MGTEDRDLLCSAGAGEWHTAPNVLGKYSTPELHPNLPQALLT